MSDLKWKHFEVAQKASERLFVLSQLKRVGLGPNELISFYCTCIHPITEYACPVFQDGLPVYPSRKLETLQRIEQCASFSYVFCMKKRLLDQVSCSHACPKHTN